MFAIRLLVSSPVLEELQLDGNAIGDGGAREVLEGLTKRKEGGLPVVRVGITSSVSPDLFAAINELTSAKPTKKKGKKKGKKVSVCVSSLRIICLPPQYYTLLSIFTALRVFYFVHAANYNVHTLAEKVTTANRSLNRTSSLFIYFIFHIIIVCVTHIYFN